MDIFCHASKVLDRGPFAEGDRVTFTLAKGADGRPTCVDLSRARRGTIEVAFDKPRARAKKKVRVCHFFEKGRCARGAECPYAHVTKARRKGAG